MESPTRSFPLLVSRVPEKYKRHGRLLRGKEQIGSAASRQHGHAAKTAALDCRTAMESGGPRGAAWLIESFP